MLWGPSHELFNRITWIESNFHLWYDLVPTLLKEKKNLASRTKLLVCCTPINTAQYIFCHNTQALVRSVTGWGWQSVHTALALVNLDVHLGLNHALQWVSSCVHQENQKYNDWISPPQFFKSTFDWSHFAQMGSQYSPRIPPPIPGLYSAVTHPFLGYVQTQNTPKPTSKQPFSWPELESGQNELARLGNSDPNWAKMFEKWTKLF